MAVEEENENKEKNDNNQVKEFNLNDEKLNFKNNEKTKIDY